VTQKRRSKKRVTPSRIRIRPVASARATATVRRLFREYAAAVGEPLCFENFGEELAHLPEPYVAPAGSLLLARVGRTAVGAVGTRRWSPTICEMKRLYVRPPFRGRGVGLALAEAILGEARRLGYARMRLDSLESMNVARAMYRRLGFREIPPYLPPSTPKTHYMELRL